MNTPPKQTSLRRELFYWVRSLSIAVAVALFINFCLIVNAVVPSGSMETTVMTGDRVFCNRLAYLRHSPERYDIVVFKTPFEGDDIKHYFKRIIGLPGETLEVIDGLVYINGSSESLRTDFIQNEPRGDFGPFEIPDNCYFMMGDNRDESHDSRYWSDPYVPGELIIGKAVFRYYPNPTLLEDID